MHDPDLTQEEIDKICEGLKQGAAKARFLRKLGVTVKMRPNGQPLVSRRHYEAIRSGGQQAGRQDSAQPVWGVH